MHSFVHRLNAMVTFALTILAVMGGLGSLSDSFNAPTHSAQVQVLNINWFQKQPNGDDQGSNLPGKEFNLTLHWHVMPVTGKMFADKIVMTGYRMPEDYR